MASDEAGTRFSQFTRIDTSRSLLNPSPYALQELLDELLSSGLWKIGGCFEDLLGTRPRSVHYSPKYFVRDGAILLAHGLCVTEYAEQLETGAIQRAKFHLRTGVNTKDQDAVSHDHYSHERPGAVYAVPVRSDVATTQEEFHAVHVSYHMERTHGTTTKEGRMAAKRAKMLDELIAAIPRQQIRRAFVHPTSRQVLHNLQVKYNLKTSNLKIYKELRALFVERYW